MLHFRWVSFLGIQRVCDNQDFIETEQLKAYSRVLEMHVQFICSLKKSKYSIAIRSWTKLTTTMNSFGLLGFVFTPRWDVQGMLQVHFYIKKNALDLMDFKRILLVLKLFYKQTNCPYKKQTLFLKKIHFKKVTKDHEEQMLSLKKQIQNQNLPWKLQIYIKWTTKFKTLMVSIKYMSHSRDSPHSHVMWWVQLGNLILKKLYRAPRWLVSLSNKSNRPSIRAYLVNAQIYTSDTWQD